MKVPDRSGERQNQPNWPTEILNIAKFSAWKFRKNTRSHAWLVWQEVTLKSPRKSGRHFSGVTRCVLARPWPVHVFRGSPSSSSLALIKFWLYRVICFFFSSKFFSAWNGHRAWEGAGVAREPFLLCGRQKRKHVEMLLLLQHKSNDDVIVAFGNNTAAKNVYPKSVPIPKVIPKFTTLSPSTLH